MAKTFKESAVQHLFEKHSCDKANHGYASMYWQLLPQFGNMLEIGVYDGASVKAWGELMPKVTKYYIDIDTRCVDYIQPPDNILISDIKNHAEINDWLGDTKFNLIIDDGSHNNKDQIQAFYNLWPKVEKGGWYVIEDLHTAYWHQSGNPWNDPKTKNILDFIQQLVHTLNVMGESEFYAKNDLSIGEIRYQKSIVAIQKI